MSVKYGGLMCPHGQLTRACFVCEQAQDVTRLENLILNYCADVLGSDSALEAEGIAIAERRFAQALEPKAKETR